MPEKVDLRDIQADDRRGRLFEVLDDTEPGEKLEVVSDRDPDPNLVRYQIERGRSLGWNHAHPNDEPRELTITVGDSLDDGRSGTIDVRDLKPQRRHESLLDIFEELEADEGFVLVNDHDPKPLYHELTSMYGDVVGWEYLKRESDEYRVAIDKTDDADADADDVVTRYDVRGIPKQERHPTIHHRYRIIPEGGTMEVVAPHEPEPLRLEFRQQYGDSFDWDVVESSPGRCRVRITKSESVDRKDVASGASDGDASKRRGDEETIEVTDELDVRDLPPAQRHERIFDAYDELTDGEGFVLVNDHDPKPLYHQFDAEAGPEFRWSYRKRDPGEFRVLVGKAESAPNRRTTGEPDAPF